MIDRESGTQRSSSSDRTRSTERTDRLSPSDRSDIRASMDVIQVGTTASGFPVYQDKLCHDADGVLVIIRAEVAQACLVRRGSV